MAKGTYKQIIWAHLQKQGRWVAGWELISVETEYGWIGSSGDRRAREMAEDGVIERRVNEEGYAEYRHPSVPVKAKASPRIPADKRASLQARQEIPTCGNEECSEHHPGWMHCRHGPLTKDCTTCRSTGPSYMGRIRSAEACGRCNHLAHSARGVCQMASCGCVSFLPISALPSLLEVARG